jgi:hypothetical protein
MSTTTAPRTVNHRQFRTGPGSIEPYVDRAELGLEDRIEFDSGRTIPAFAEPTYGPSRAPFGPFRELSPAQAAHLERDTTGAPGIGQHFLADVRADGVAVVVLPCGHYVPVISHVDRDGRVTRTN